MLVQLKLLMFDKVRKVFWCIIQGFFVECNPILIATLCHFPSIVKVPFLKLLLFVPQAGKSRLEHWWKFCHLQYHVLPGTIWSFHAQNRLLYLWQPEAPKKVLWSTFFFLRLLAYMYDMRMTAMGLLMFILENVGKI